MNISKCFHTKRKKLNKKLKGGRFGVDCFFIPTKDKRRQSRRRRGRGTRVGRDEWRIVSSLQGGF